MPQVVDEEVTSRSEDEEGTADGGVKHGVRMSFVEAACRLLSTLRESNLQYGRETDDANVDVKLDAVTVSFLSVPATSRCPKSLSHRLDP